MRRGFYSKLAISNLKKNARFYVPRILTEMGLLASFYILLTLTLDERLREIKGGEYLPGFMLIGVAVMTILSVILLLYINSFLMKQRKREFGLYNILGMEKRHVTRVLFFESLFSGEVSVIGGLLTGILLYKLCSLAIIKLLQEEVKFGFNYINAKPLMDSALAYIAIDVLVFILNCITITKLKPVELLSSSHTGEKEPKVKWPLLVLGLITLGVGYALALCVKSPVKAASVFFIAVILVVIGTYCLFVAGTIWVLKLLKANKKFYYNRKHMPAVSGLLYRMKQNAVGLASITILATIVLVMISTTVSLYSGLNQSLTRNFQEDLYFSCDYIDLENNLIRVPQEKLEGMVRNSAEKYHVDIDYVKYQRYMDSTFNYQNGKLEPIMGNEAMEDDTLTSMTDTIIMTAKDYEKLTGNAMDLNKGEVAVYHYDKKSPVKGGSFELANQHFEIKETLTSFPIGSTMEDMLSKMGIVVATEEELQSIDVYFAEEYGARSEIKELVAVKYADRGQMLEQGANMEDDTENQMKEYFNSLNKNEGCSYSYNAYWKQRDMFLGMYGSLLFLGIILGIVFMFATALIIYYKQISEGYEDANRFRIMEKVGMSNKEVRGTIKSQILLVFFLPILVAGIHMCVASPILLKMLHIFALASDSLYIICAVIVYVIFVLLYTLIYMGTAKTYYKIVK